MLIFRPLMRLLSERKMSFDDFLMKIGKDYRFRDALNSGRYVRMDTLDRMCGVLGCNIGDILEHVEGEKRVTRKPDTYAEIDWDAFVSAVGSLGMTPEQASVRLGRSRSFIGNMIRRGRTKYRTFREVCTGLGLDVKMFTKG